MTSPAPERVFPASNPPSGPSAPSPGLGRLRVDKKTLAWVGAGVVAVVALFAGRNQSTDPEASGTAELDTSETDLYNELQPELENISDQLSELQPGVSTGPRPPKPHTPIPRDPTLPMAGPKPPDKGGNKHKYVVKNGDTLAAIAKRHKVQGGRIRLYTVNRVAIERAAHQHGKKSSQGGKLLFAGTVLVLP